MQLPDIEVVAALVHAAWMKTKLDQGITSRLAEDGEELMAPYGVLSEHQKDADRNTVKAVYAALEAIAGADQIGKKTSEVLRLKALGFNESWCESLIERRAEDCNSLHPFDGCKDASDAFADCFLWSTTPEGSAFWTEAYVALSLLQDAEAFCGKYPTLETAVGVFDKSGAL